VAAVIQHLGVSEATYHRWRNQYGGMKAEEAKRLKELESENVRLKRLSGLLVERCGGLWIASNRGNFCMLRTGDR
jgi:transposase-like protein